MLVWIAGELTGMILLVAFVVALSSMPPLQVTRQANVWTGYKISVDTEQWRTNATTYWENIKQGSLGVDRQNRPVGPRVATRFKNSLVLIGVAAVLAIIFGVLKGFWDFRSLRRSKLGIGPMLTSAVQGLPDFWLIIMFQLVAIWLYNTYGWRPLRIVYNSENEVNSMVIPVICLALIPGSFVARMTSTALSAVWEKDYIRTARSKGLHEFSVLFKHAFRNAAVQVLDGLPGVVAVMVANLLIVEYMFAYPGLTTLLKEAVPTPALDPTVAPLPADVPVLAAAGFCMGVTFSLLHFLVNIARRIADPRLKERGAA